MEHLTKGYTKFMNKTMRFLTIACVLLASFGVLRAVDPAVRSATTFTVAGVQAGGYHYCADAAGSGTTYTCTMTPTLTAYTTGMTVTFKPGTANTGGSTVNIDALGAKTIIAANTTGSALVADDLIANGIYTLEYDGTNFRKINGPSTAWTAFSYSNSWTDFGSSFQVGQYRKDNWGQVYLRGVIAPGTKTAATTMFTLPAGYRPVTKSLPFGSYNIGTEPGIHTFEIALQTSGAAQVANAYTGTYVTVDGVNFSVY